MCRMLPDTPVLPPRRLLLARLGLHRFPRVAPIEAHARIVPAVKHGRPENEKNDPDWPAVEGVVD
jgi:hypothetical protein